MADMESGFYKRYENNRGSVEQGESADGEACLEPLGGGVFG